MRMVVSEELIVTDGNNQISDRLIGINNVYTWSETPTCPNKQHTAAAFIFSLIYLKKMDIQSEKERVEAFQLSSHILIIPK